MTDKQIIKVGSLDELYLTQLQEQLDQLKTENEKLKNNTTSFDYLDSLTNEQVASLYTATIDELAIRGFKAKYNTEASLLTQYQQALTEIKQLLEDALDTDKTSVEQSFDNFYKAIKLCEVLDE